MSKFERGTLVDVFDREARALKHRYGHAGATVRLTAAQRAALAMFGSRSFMFQEDVCTTRIARQLDAIGLIVRSPAARVGERVTLRLTPAGRTALESAS